MTSRPVGDGRYLVTGGAGFIGANFVHLLMERYPRARVTVLDKLTYAGNPANLAPVRDRETFRFVQGDIADDGLVEPLIAEGFDFVINFAAETHVDRSIGDPASFVKTDVFGVYTLLEAIRTHPVSLFVQISTDEVYGEVMEGAATEEAPLMPRNPYSASKAGGDRLAFSYWATYGLPVVVTRCSNNYGPYQYPEKLIPLFVTNAIDHHSDRVGGGGGRAVQYRRGERKDGSGNCRPPPFPDGAAHVAPLSGGGSSRTRPPICGRLLEAPPEDRLGSPSLFRGGSARDGRLVQSPRGMVAPAQERRIPRVLQA